MSVHTHTHTHTRTHTHTLLPTPGLRLVSLEGVVGPEEVQFAVALFKHVDSFELMGRVHQCLLHAGRVDVLTRHSTGRGGGRGEGRRRKREGEEKEGRGGGGRGESTYTHYSQDTYFLTSNGSMTVALITRTVACARDAVTGSIT